jgi:hypothetical protein
MLKHDDRQPLCQHRIQQFQIAHLYYELHHAYPPLPETLTEKPQRLQSSKAFGFPLHPRKQPPPIVKSSALPSNSGQQPTPMRPIQHHGLAEEQQIDHPQLIADREMLLKSQ